MLICVKPNIPDFLDSISVPEVILRDNFGQKIKNISKITLKMIPENICLVTVEYYEENKESIRTFFLKSCTIDLSSIGVQREKEKFHPSIELARKRKIPWYVKLAIKVIDIFLKKEDSTI